MNRQAGPAGGGGNANVTPQRRKPTMNLPQLHASPARRAPYADRSAAFISVEDDEGHHVLCMPITGPWPSFTIKYVVGIADEPKITIVINMN